ncbi:hypothetical protein [Pedobacter steynii]
MFIPYNTAYGTGDINLNSVNSLRATYPKYVAQRPYFASATITNADSTISFEKAEDINELAFKTLNQRFAKEMGKILTRLAVKKSAEYALKASAKEMEKTVRTIPYLRA